MNPPPDPDRATADPAPRLSVVIVNYNAWDDIVRLVESLASSAEVRSGASEIVIVDNASDDPPPSELFRHGPNVRLLPEADNGGFAAGVNSGWRAARANWLLVLNPDVVPASDLLTRVIERIDRDAAVPDGPPGIVGFGLRNPDGSPQPSVGAMPNLARSFWEQVLPRSRRKYRAAWRTRPGPVPWVTGACVLIDGELLETLDGMDEDFFLYYEEVAFCRSATHAGRRVEYDPSIQVVHLRPLQNRSVSLKMRVITRHSKLLYFLKHRPRWEFRTLAAIVRLEAGLRSLGGRWMSRSTDVRTWRAIGRMARDLEHDDDARLKGRAVRVLAEQVTQAPLPTHVRPARSRGAAGPVPEPRQRPDRARLASTRGKDGPT